MFLWRSHAGIFAIALYVMLPFPAVAMAASGDVPSIMFGGFERVLISGALMMMGIYHLMIFFLRRRDWASMSLASFCLLSAYYSLCAINKGRGLLQLLPHADPDIAFASGMISLMALTLSLQLYFKAVFPRQFPLWGIYVFAFVVGAYIAVRFGLGINLGPTVYIYMTVMLTYTLVNLIRASQANESGAKFLLVGHIVLISCGLNDVAIGWKLISSIWLAPFGLLGFVLAQSGLLAHRFSQSLVTSELLSARLEQQNTLLETEIAHRAELQARLDAIAEDERRFVSRALHDGLCQDLAAARLNCSFWQSPTGKHDKEKAFSKVSELLESALNQAYELSLGLWPIEEGITDLPEALRNLGKELTAEHGMAVSVNCPAGDLRLSEAQNERVFLIAKETLKNAAKHSQARIITLNLLRDEGAGLRLVVEDDGIGLGSKTPTAGGLGAKIMKHHARFLGGTVTHTSRTEGGVRTELAVPRI